jgi:hypothetical protein
MRQILILCGFTLALATSKAQLSQNQTPGYTGSVACKTCHPAVYERWKRTRMAKSFAIRASIPMPFCRISPSRTRS